MSDDVVGIHNKPPSRRGKKQIIAYLEPEIVDQMKEFAHMNEKSYQEIVGISINQYMIDNKEKEVYDPIHFRIVRRRKGQSAIKEEEKVAPCRSGKKSISGWFDNKLTDQANKIAEKHIISLSKIVKLGFLSFLEATNGTTTEEEDDDNQK